MCCKTQKNLEMILDIDKSIVALLMLSGMVGAEAYAGNNTNAPDSVGSVKTLQELVVTGEGAERNLKAAEMPSLILIFQRSHGSCEVAESSGYIPSIMNFKLDL